MRHIASVSQSDAEKLVIELRAGAAINAVLKDENGIALAGKPVRLELTDSFKNENAFYANRDSRTVLTDKDGRWSLNTLSTHTPLPA